MRLFTCQSCCAKEANVCAGSRVSGFVRFLHLLSTHSWREQALIVDPNAELAAADREAVVAAHSKVVATRQRLPLDPSAHPWQLRSWQRLFLVYLLYDGFQAGYQGRMELVTDASQLQLYCVGSMLAPPHDCMLGQYVSGCPSAAQSSSCILILTPCVHHRQGGMERRLPCASSRLMTQAPGWGRASARLWSTVRAPWHSAACPPSRSAPVLP